MRGLRRLGGMVPQVNLKCCRLGKVLQRPEHCRIRGRDLEGEGVSGGVRQQTRCRIVVSALIRLRCYGSGGVNKKLIFGETTKGKKKSIFTLVSKTRGPT